jgi:hypothetical protein
LGLGNRRWLLPIFGTQKSDHAMNVNSAMAKSSADAAGYGLVTGFCLSRWAKHRPHIPKAMMPSAYATPTLKAPGRTKVRVHACRLVIALGVFIVLAASANGQTPVFIQDVVSSDEAGPSGITSVACWKEGTASMRETGCVAKIGDVVSLEVRNLAVWLERLRTDKVITSGETGDALLSEQLPNLRLFIGEHLMRTLQPTQYIKDDPTWYPADPMQSKAALGRSWLEFNLKRDAANKDSRADWDQVLRTSGISPKMPLAVGIYNANRNTAHVMSLPVGTHTADPRMEFHFRRIAWDGWTIVGLILLIGAIVGFLYLLLRSGIVRDTTCAVREDGLPPLSLGRCQMAFWFFLVICAFYFLWLITGRGDTDTVNSTILILIGISAGTALGSAIVSKNEAATAAASKGPPSRPAVVYPEAIDKAQAALAQAKLDKDAVKIQAQTSEVARLEGELKRWRALHRSRLLLDLLSDEDASADQGRVITFHRFQIVVWTLVLGVVFVSEVLTKLAMPVFDTTLLTLVGISSGTYLGFKVSK